MPPAREDNVNMEPARPAAEDVSRPPILSYSTIRAMPQRRSPFVYVSIAFVCLSVLWKVYWIFNERMNPFTSDEHNEFGLVLAVIATASAAGSYRPPFRRCWLSHVAIALSILAAAFAMTVLRLRW